MITPAPIKTKIPSLLDLPSPELLTYPLESVVAEKFEAMVSLGLANSRMKDFFDLGSLSREFPFEGTSLQVVYLVFNAGYSPETTGAEPSREAIRLGRLLLDLLPEPEVMGLLGLMLLQESRRPKLCGGRVDPAGPAGSLVVEQGSDR